MLQRARGQASVAERFTDRAWLDLREVLAERLHGALHLANPREAQLRVLALALQLGIARQRERCR